MLVRSKQSWFLRHYALLAGLIVLGIYVHGQPLWDMMSIGLNDQEQTHIFLAPLVAIYLLWLRRSRLRHVFFQPSFAGLGVVVAGYLISWWGFMTDTQIAWHGGALISITGLLLSMTGLTPLSLFSPVFVVLLFILPVPGVLRHKIAYPLQELATTVTHSMLELLGVTAVKSGNVLTIAGQQVAVGEACNGMRMVFALTLVVYAFAFGTALRPGTRLLLIGLSPLIAILCNVVRLVPTSLIYAYGTVTEAQRFHDVAGWVMLPIALLMLAAVLRAIQWLEFPVTTYRLASQS